MNNELNRSNGWNWSSFFFGPFWYIARGLVYKGVMLLIIAILTIGFAVPIVWFYCGLRGNSDLYEKKIRLKSKIDLNKI